jgi:hypothetical protein
MPYELNYLCEACWRYLRGLGCPGDTMSILETMMFARRDLAKVFVNMHPTS